MMQPMLQKVADRLSWWKRNFLSYLGRELLMKMVLSAIPTFYMIVFKMSKKGINFIDRFRRGFLWKGEDLENVKGGRCLVNWDTCQMPKRLGGLGFKDLDKFNRALRLRWLWHQWDVKDKPWKDILKMKDDTVSQLFFCSTDVRVGNGKNTPFWKARWLKGTTPKDLAPNLFKIARYKRRTVSKELHNDNWVRNLENIDSEILIEEFTMLFMALSNVTLNDHQDIISWRWTPDG
jgi:hypothetical protein